MKALKITLTLMAIALLTVSGVQSDNVVEIANEKKIESPTKIDLLAHGKEKMKSPRKG